MEISRLGRFLVRTQRVQYPDFGPFLVGPDSLGDGPDELAGPDTVGPTLFFNPLFPPAILFYFSIKKNTLFV